MAFRLEQSVLRGEIDNRNKGVVRGRLWLLGRTEPVQLNLKGNAYPDLAGCLLEFTNRKPGPAHPGLDTLAPEQNGNIGDLTASRKLRTFDLPFEETYAMIDRGEKPPERVSNALYLEWFSEGNGRVVIESTDYELKVSAPEWTATPEDEAARARLASDGLRAFLDKLTDAVEGSRHTGPEDSEVWDEFDFEKSLKESDAVADKYSELLDKYGHDDEAQKIIAREMGWTRLEEKLEARDKGEFSDFDLDDLSEEPLEEPEPNPATEGIDWVREKDGAIHHPLASRAFHASLRLSRLLDETENEILLEFVFKVQTVGAKLAGSLNSIWRDEDVSMPGFIVATLKRALGHLHKAQEVFQPVKQASSLAPEELVYWERELAEIREEILRLMEVYRQRVRDEEDCDE